MSGERGEFREPSLGIVLDARSIEKLINLIASVEGEAWANSDRLQAGSDGSVQAALVILQERQTHATEAERTENPFVATIYGANGINRYKVRLGGQVLFSGFHNRQSVHGNLSFEKAREAGFEIFD
jgi:hypothetical protein